MIFYLFPQIKCPTIIKDIQAHKKTRHHEYQSVEQTREKEPKRLTLSNIIIKN